MSENEENLKGENQLNISKNNSSEEKNDSDSEESRKINNEEYQKLRNMESDRKLKERTQTYIIIILCFNIFFTFLLIYFNFFFNKKYYSEWFLSVLIGSQLIILPFSLLFIVAKHLFPNKDK